MTRPLQRDGIAGHSDPAHAAAGCSLIVALARATGVDPQVFLATPDHQGDA